MRLLLLLIVLSLLVATVPTHAQDDVVTVEVEPTETCPSGWATVDTAWTKPARTFYTLPATLVDGYRRTHIGRIPATVEISVSQAFVDTVWPTLTQRQAAYTSGQLRDEPATSGTVRNCTLG